MGVIDRIVPINKGTWVNNESYDKLNIVRHGSSVYQSKIDNNTSEPSETNTDWMFLVRDGYDGGVAHVEWDSVEAKPFKTLNTSDFSVSSSGVLSVIGGGGGGSSEEVYKATLFAETRMTTIVNFPYNPFEGGTGTNLPYRNIEIVTNYYGATPSKILYDATSQRMSVNFEGDFPVDITVFAIVHL